MRCADEEVELELVGHQYEAERLSAEPPDRQSESIDQTPVVPFVVEDPLARISPAHDMIDGASVLDSQRPAHALRLAARERCVNRKPDLTACIALSLIPRRALQTRAGEAILSYVNRGFERSSLAFSGSEVA